jgi:hypothetical protein
VTSLSFVDGQEAELHMERLYLPLCKSGIGLLCLTDGDGVISKAGFLAAAALTQSALEEGASAFQPLSDAGAAKMASSWEQFSAFCSLHEPDGDTSGQNLLEAYACYLHLLHK